MYDDEPTRLYMVSVDVELAGSSRIFTRQFLLKGLFDVRRRTIQDSLSATCCNVCLYLQLSRSHDVGHH
jgi:hypothetical protein